jgi:HSP20 family protein
MRVLVGDRILVESERASRSPKHGVIEEILSVDPPRFVVRWGDGHTSIFTPNAGVAQIEGRGRLRRGAVPIEATTGGGTRMSQQTLPEHRRSQEVQQQERFDPFGEFEQVTERMQRLLDRTFGGVLGSRPALERGAGGFAPIADIEEQDDAYVVEVELPGVRREDVTIELVGNELAITGEVKEEERQGVVRRRMRRYGRFDYRVTLPDQLDADKVDATLEDGLLTVRVPKAQKAQRRQIDIKGTNSGSRSRSRSRSS